MSDGTPGEEYESAMGVTGEPEPEPAPKQPSVREMAAALVTLGIQEQEGRVHQASVALNMLQVQLQAARIRAPMEIERLAREMEAALQ
jgi:hypothetical protein